MLTPQKAQELLTKVDELINATGKAELQFAAFTDLIHPNKRTSAKNLLHYLSLRSFDLRILQNELAGLALSSLSHSEAYTLYSLQQLKYLLSLLAGQSAEEQNITSEVSREVSIELLNKNSAALFGEMDYEGETKIMVTLPSEASGDYNVVFQLVNSGMHIARINTAHDDLAAWENMIQNCRLASERAGKQLRIYMDLTGPKIRIEAVRSQYIEDTREIFAVYPGQHICLARENTPPHNRYPTVYVSPDSVFDFIKAGDNLWFDDGKTSAAVKDVDGTGIILEITNAPGKGCKLTKGKGINLPLSELSLPILSEQDKQLLPFIVEHADMVGLSFVQTAEDVKKIQGEIKALSKKEIGIILKIETAKALDHLPALLLQAMQSAKVGIMIARGDLAVELGLLRMAEVQEEIMWLAEAAHLPVVWATQVLDRQIKKGFPTRAEISDVVKATRAECVLLNKGPNITDAIKTFQNIDKRMASHEYKKHNMLRALSLAKSFLQK